MIKPDNTHITRWVGTSYHEDGLICVRVAYGVLSSVYADQACNYSYREFWI